MRQIHKLCFRSEGVKSLHVCLVFIRCSYSEKVEAGIPSGGKNGMTIEALAMLEQLEEAR